MEMSISTRDIIGYRGSRVNLPFCPVRETRLILTLSHPQRNLQSECDQEVFYGHGSELHHQTWTV